VIEWHINSGYPLYNAEGRSKWRAYPPPYNGGYATPWAWVDGKSRSYQYSQWATYVYQQLTVPSDVQLAIGGTYDPGSRAGTAVIEMLNSSASAISATAQVVITEDSIYYAGPNGDPWHNHVCRDYVPDYNGTLVTIPASGADTLTIPYALDPGWNQDRCNVVVYVHKTDVQPDSSRPVYNGAIVKVMTMTGTAEPPARREPRMTVSCRPNPFRTRTVFSVSAAANTPYRLSVYSADGGLVRESVGTLPDRGELEWNAAGLPRGVYAYRLTTGAGTAQGKLVLLD